MKKLRLILGDQLNINHSWFQEKDENIVYCIFEMRQETDYVIHHIQKVIAFFLAMRRFSEILINKGFNVHYIKLDDKENAVFCMTQNIRTLW